MNKEGKKKYSNAFDATWVAIKGRFIKKERIGEILDSERIDGMNILITGATSGLGFATAVRLAERGGTVIMAVRSGIPHKGEEVKHISGSEKVEMIFVDLSDLISIENLCMDLKQRGIKIDVLICNAAIVPARSRKSPQDLEEMFVVNYLSKFYLVNRLLELDSFSFIHDGFPRIIIVSSESHRNPNSFEWNDFGIYKEYSMNEVVKRYGYFKLLLTTFARELSRRLNPNGNVKFQVSALCPGPVNSNIAREAPSWAKPLLKGIFSVFFRSPMKASDPVVYMAVTQGSDKREFDYLYLMSQKPIDSLADQKENGMKLWQKSENLINSIKKKYSF